MTHLSDEQLNEVLDDSLFDNSIIGHLDTCDDCRARLEDLRVVFTALESLPEVQLSHDLTDSILTRLPRSQPVRSWTWLSLAQAFGALAIFTWLASSFILPPEIVSYQPPTIDSLLASAIQLLSSFTFEVPTFDLQSSTIDLQSTTILTFIGSAIVLWFVGNGLLLRAPVRGSGK